MGRLQAKLRDFIRIEKKLQGEIKEITMKDDRLVSQLEEAICFGKLLFVAKPVQSQEFEATYDLINRNAEQLFKSKVDERKEKLVELNRSIEEFLRQTKENKQKRFGFLIAKNLCII